MYKYTVSVLKIFFLLKLVKSITEYVFVFNSIKIVQPLIKVTNQLVGAPVNRNVTLQCTVEASPRAMNTWYRDKGID